MFVQVRNSRTLRLSDKNDNAPVFEKDEYTVNISEVRKLGILITK